VFGGGHSKLQNYISVLTWKHEENYEKNQSTVTTAVVYYHVIIIVTIFCSVLNSPCALRKFTYNKGKVIDLVTSLIT
jgi:hypothetical protein